MKRDTRINLLFLAVFLAISLPGAVILFKKKLDPNAARMDQPDAIVRELPYMAPLPAPPGVKWIAPPRTRQWLIELNGRLGVGDHLLSGRNDTSQWEPVISEDHALQVISASHSDPGLNLSLVIWDPLLQSAAEDCSFGAEAGGQSFAGKVKSWRSIIVPEEIKRELMGLHMIRPPANVTWVHVEFSEVRSEPVPVRVKMDYHGPGGLRQSVVLAP